MKNTKITNQTSKTLEPLIQSNEVTSRLTNMETNNTITKTNTTKQSRKVMMSPNQDIKRWFESPVRGSTVTAEVRLRRLDKFARYII